MARILRHAVGLFVLSGLLPVPLSAVPGADRTAACIGAPNVVEFHGVIGEEDADAAGKLVLLHGERRIDFAVAGARRLGGPPADVLQILQRLGPGTPRLQVVGPESVIAPLLRARAGTRLELRGVLDEGNRYFQLLEARGASGES